MVFDARKAKLLPIGEHLIIDDCPGLRLVSSSAGKSWIYRFKSPIDDKMRQVKFGQWPALSVSAAIEEWERLRDIRAAGSDPSIERKQAKVEEKQFIEKQREAKKQSEYTLDRLCSDYLQGHVARSRKEKSVKEIGRMFRTMLGSLADVPAAKLTRAQAFSLIESYLEIPVQATILKRELGAAYDYALDAGRIPEETPNWWRLILRGKIKSKGKVIRGKNVGTAKRFLNEEELAKVLRFLPNYSKLCCDLLTMYLWTCTRGAEICAIEGREISQEVDGHWWTIPKAKTKNARHAKATDQRVPLVGRSLEIVMRRKELYGDGYLFPLRGDNNRHVEQKVVQVEVWARWPETKRPDNCKRPILDMERWAPHDLRRSVRTLLARLGCRDEVAEALLGHMPEGIRSTYNRHTYDNEKREWIEKLSAELESMVK